MRPPLPTGYLAYGALPDWARPRNCRYCGVEMVTTCYRPVCDAA